jgi:flagellar assembly protein FliH
MSLVFDRDFDLELEQEQQARQRLERARHTAEELEEARAQGRAAGMQEGFAQGHREALAQAAQDADVQRRATQQQIAEGLSALFQASDAHADTLEEQALAFALSVFERVAPEFLKSRSTLRAEQEIRDALKLTLGSGSVRVFLPASAGEEGAAGIMEAARALGQGDRVTITQDPALASGGARVEWDNGFMEYSFDKICEQILTALRAAAPTTSGRPQPDTKKNPAQE